MVFSTRKHFLIIRDLSKNEVSPLDIFPLNGDVQVKTLGVTVQRFTQGTEGWILESKIQNFKIL